jgi:beta-mannosidase
MNTMQFAHADNLLDLSGQWALVSVDGKYATKAAIPGDVHAALIAASLIPDPYVGRNEALVQWVANTDWVITREFALDSKEFSGWYLDIDYLDTIADVKINGELVLAARNCFQRYRPDVSAALKQGVNKIEILFHSNPKTANELQASMPFFIPYSKDNCPIPNVNMLRKPQCHFGWDWNIAIAPLGLYGHIELKRRAVARIEHVQVNQVHGADFVDVSIATHLDCLQSGSTSLSISLNGEIVSIRIDVSVGAFTHIETIRITSPKLWWPNGSGAQPLYDLEVAVEGDVIKRKIGLRTIELIAEADSVGRSFSFRVNGHDIYCRGSNWIPADALPSRATPELTEKLLQAAVDSHQNMIRVWGGGFYEQDFFYELCDRLGLMVWQDFMYSCSLYPSTPDFLSEVKSEVNYQVRRLQHHACLALWCGDNELIGALNWFEVSRKDRDRYLVSYDRLNRTIEEGLLAAEPSANWWPSSPSPGVLSFGDAWHDDSSGDMHFWSVWHEGKNFEHYRDVKPRFCSEFGFQSFPSLKIARKFGSEDDLNISSPVMESHQKNAGGNARIAETMFRYFRFPMDFGDFVYLSQVQQGLAIKTAVEYWRSLKPHNMGALYWQLNDTWPVASWASLDHGGGWKIMHHMVQQFFQPVAVFAIPSQDGEAIRIVAVNDTRDPVSVDVALKAVNMDGTVRELSTASGLVPVDKSSDLAWLSVHDIGKDALLVFEFTASNSMAGRGHHVPVAYKLLPLVTPKISISSQRGDAGVQITLKSAGLALHVSLETDEPGRFDAGGFDMLAGETRVVRFIADETAILDKVSTSLIVRDLYGATYGVTSK